jgi:hypothetical protein
MNAAAWGLIGILVGSVITITGNVLMHRLERSERGERARAEETARAREERKLAYMRLLTVARRLRYLSRPNATRDAGVIETLKTELSTVRYEIELIAPPGIAEGANTVRRATLDYLNEATTTSTASFESLEQSADVKRLRRTARTAVHDFIEAARDELESAAATGGAGDPMMRWQRVLNWHRFGRPRGIGF